MINKSDKKNNKYLIIEKIFNLNKDLLKNLKANKFKESLSLHQIKKKLRIKRNTKNDILFVF